VNLEKYIFYVKESMPRISEDKIDEVRTSVNIVHYIQQFVNLKKAGQNFKGLCPFHTEKTPSFVVSPAKQIYRCFGCGKGGNVYTFIKDYEKLPFSEALQKAADFAGIALPKQEISTEETGYFQKLFQINETASQFFEKNLWMGQYKKHLNYFRDRGLTDETIKNFRLGFAPDSFDKLLNTLKSDQRELAEADKLGLIRQRDNQTSYYDKFRYRVIFPFINVSGKIIGFGGRKLQEEQQPKYLNSPESPVYKKGELLYGLNQAIQPIREQGSVLVVEGYFDLLRLVESGIKNVVASSGTAFTDNQTRLLRRYTKNVYVVYDGDQPGIKAAIRAAQVIEKEGLNAFITPLPPNDDPDTFVLENGVAAFEKQVKNSVALLDFQIAYFNQQNPNPSIEKKEEFIQEILNQLAEMTNQVKTGLYLHQLADQLQINENILLNQLNRFRNFRQKKQAAPQDKAVPVKIQSGNYNAEAGIIGLLLNAKSEVRNQILSHISLDLFENESLARLYEHMMHEFEESGKLDSGRILDQFTDDEEVVKLIAEVSIKEFGDEQKFVNDCIFQLQRYQLEKRNKELEQHIRHESDSADAVEHYYRQLMETKKELNTLVKAHRSL